MPLCPTGGCLCTSIEGSGFCRHFGLRIRGATLQSSTLRYQPPGSPGARDKKHSETLRDGHLPIQKPTDQETTIQKPRQSDSETKLMVRFRNQMSRFRNQMGRFRNQASPDSETKTADSETKSDDSETKPGDSATTIQKPKQPLRKPKQPMQKPSQTIQKPSQTMVAMGWRAGGVWGGEPWPR